MAFYTITRGEGEERGVFIKRVWTTLNPDYSDESDDPARDLRSVARLVVGEGAESPYRFVKTLRDMVGDPDAPVFQAMQVIKGFAHFRYYCYRMHEDERAGPYKAVVYDPTPVQPTA